MKENRKLLGNLSCGLVFVISAPAGTGKSTLVSLLLQEFPDALQKCCSSTTRSARIGEVDSHDYDFLSQKEFEQKIEAGEFVEHVELFGNRYGTRLQLLESIVKRGKHAILVIDVQGAMQVRAKMDALCIFVCPPTLLEQKERLEKRGSETGESMEKRLKQTAYELQMAQFYDYQLTNDNLETTYQILRSIVIAEEHKRIK